MHARDYLQNDLTFTAPCNTMHVVRVKRATHAVSRITRIGNISGHRVSA